MPKSEESSGLVRWVAANPLTAASLTGGVCYLVVFDSYRAALRPFGLVPSEVGIDYASAVWPAAQVLAVFLLGCALVQGFASTFAFVKMLERRLPYLLFLAGAALTALSVVAEAQFVHLVWNGKPFDPWLSGRLSLLSGLRADLVEVVWKEPTETKPKLPQGEVLMLGVSNGVAVLFVATSHSTWRLPAGDVIITAKGSRLRDVSPHGGPKPVK